MNNRRRRKHQRMVSARDKWDRMPNSTVSIQLTSTEMQWKLCFHLSRYCRLQDGAPVLSPWKGPAAWTTKSTPFSASSNIWKWKKIDSVQYQVQVIDNIGRVAIERNFNGDCWQTGQGTIWCFNASFIYKLASKRLRSPRRRRLRGQGVAIEEYDMEASISEGRHKKIPW
jgi:hypothetical protein